MAKLKIKVCGMRSPGNIADACSLGIHYMGFIFYPPSARYVGRSLDAAARHAVAAGVAATGVFVNSSQDDIVPAAEASGLRALQLHGTESPELCAALRSRGYFVIKAIGVSCAADFEAAEQYSHCSDILLFDTKSASHGGTGQKFDWSLIGQYKGPAPFWLSGGIGPGDALLAKEIALSNSLMQGIDLNSRFETAPALKDIRSLKAFIDELNA
jgi:phosphoribosylanthranilate isomerase